MSTFNEEIQQQLDDGFIVLPINPNTKACFEKGWSTWTIEDARNFWDSNTDETLQYGRLMSSTHICIDFDLENKDAQNFWNEHGHKFNDFYIEVTPNGYHIEGYTDEPQKYLGAKNNSKGKQIGLEIITAKHLIVTYPSTFKGSSYEYIDPTNSDTLKDRLQTIPQNLIDLIRDYVENLTPSRQTKTRPKTSSKVTSPSTDSNPTIEELQEILDTIPPDLPYDEWLKIGMGLAHYQNTEDTEDLFPLFDDFSSKSKKYNKKTTLQKWKSFDQSGNPPITIASVLDYRQLEPPIDPEQILSHIQPVEPEKPPKTLEEIKAQKIELPKEDNSIKHISELLPDTFFLNFPGLIGRMTREICSRSSNPSPAFAFSTALNILSAIKAGKIESRFMSHTSSASMYCFCLADSTYGKAYYKDVILNVLSRLNLEDKLETSVISAQGLHKGLQNKQGTYRPHLSLCIDEVHELLSNISHKTAQSYERGISGALLELFTSHTNPAYGNATKATKESEKDVRRPLKFPTLSLAGFGTKQGIENIFTEVNLNKGFVNRCLIFLENRQLERLSFEDMFNEENELSAKDSFDFEADLLRIIQELNNYCLAQALPQNDSNEDDEDDEDEDVNHKNMWEPKYLHVSKEAQKLLYNFYMETRVDVVESKKVLYGRAVEMVNRIATTVADTELGIDKEVMEHCIKLVRAYLSTMDGQLSKLEDENSTESLEGFIDYIKKRMVKLDRNYVTVQDLTANMSKKQRRMYDVGNLLSFAVSQCILKVESTNEIKERVKLEGKSSKGSYGKRYYFM